MIFPLMAKIFNSVVWTSEPLLIGEMSPTLYRNTFYGLICFAGEIGSVFAPYLNVLVNDFLYKIKYLYYFHFGYRKKFIKARHQY